MPACAAPPVLAFALWPLVRACPGPRSGGQPHPDAADPWGEDHAADLLTDYEPEEVGPFLTVTASTDGTTCRVVFAGDATEALLGYAARVARDVGYPSFEGSAVEQAREAFAVAVDGLAYEFGVEAVQEWECPDPDTWRNARRMPESTRAALRESVEAEAHRVEAEALDAHLCKALGITNDGHDAAAPAPLPLAA